MLKQIILSSLLGFNFIYANNYENFNSEIIKLNKEKKLKEKNKIKHRLIDMVDFKLMGKLSIGKEIWLKLNKKEKEDYLLNFENMVRFNYIKYITEITNINIKEVKRNKTKYLIRIQANNHKIKVYAYEKGDLFKIYNIEIDGVNLIKMLGGNYRAQYQIEGMEGILKQLKETNKKKN